MRSEPRRLPRATPSLLASPRRWGLEPLEPRVLLSADPVLAAVQAVLLPDLGDTTLAGAYAGPDAGAVSPVAPIHADALIDASAGGLLVIGKPGSGQAIVLDRGDHAPVVSQADLVLWADGTGGEVRLASPLLAPSLEINGSGHTTTLSADQSVAVGSFSINDSLRVDGQRSITAAAGSILLGGNSTHFLGGNSALTVDTLTLSAANGNITIRGPVGNGQEGSDPLSGLTISAAQNVTFQQALVIDGDLLINATGIVSFQDQLTLRNGGDLIIQGAAQVFMQGRVLLQTGNAATPGVFSISADEIDLAMSEELIQGSGAVTLRPATLGTAIAVLSPAGAATNGVLNIESTELRAFADGFASFTIGQVGGDGHAQAGSGAVSVGANAALDGLAFRDRVSIYGGSITVVDYSDRNAVFRLGAGDALRLDAVGDITLANEVEVDQATLFSATGLVQQVDANADNRIGEALRTPDLLVQAVTGVNLPSVEGQRVDLLNSGAGDITLGVGAARATTRFAASELDGDIDIVRIAQTATSGGNDVAVSTAAGSIALLAGPGISVAGSGGVSLLAHGAGADLNLAAPIGVVSGAVSLSAADDVHTTADATITASGAAPITLASGTGALVLLAPVTSAGGPVSFASGAALDLSAITVSGGPSGVVALQAAGTLTLGVVDASSSITITSTGGSILDGLAGDAANLRGDAAAAVLNAAAGIGTGAAPLRTLVASLEAHNSTSGGIFVAEETALSVAAGGLSTAGSGAGVGAIVVHTAAGSLDVQGAVSANATGAGSGHILLQAQGAPGDLYLAADVVSASGSISLLAAQALLLAGPGTPAAATQVRTQATGQTLDLRAGGAMTMAADASLQTNHGALRLEAGGAVVLGRADAGSGTLSVQAGGAITGAPGAPARNDLTAGALRLAAVGAIGSATDALGISATNLSAQAVGGGVFLAGAGALTVASVAGAPALRVAADGSAAALPLDAAQAGVAASGGVVLQLAGGALNLGAGGGGVFTSSQHVLLATPGDISLAAAVTATVGQVSVIAGGALATTDAGDISSGGSGGIDLQAGGAITMAAGTEAVSAGGPVRVAAGGNLALGRLDAGSGNLALSGATITGLSPGTDLSGTDLRINATGAVGSGADPLRTQVQRLAVQAAGNGLYLQETDAVDVAELALAAGQRVGADGQLLASPPTDAELAGLSSGGALVLQTGGALAAGAGTPVQAAGALRLAAVAGSDLSLAAAVSSAAGSVSLAAGRDLLLSAAVSLAGAGRSLDLSAGRDLRMSGDALLQTIDGPQSLQAAGDIALRSLTAGTGGVAMVAGGSVLDGDGNVDVTAGTLLVRAGVGIGSGGDPLEVDVALLAASAGMGGLFVEEQAGVVVDNASVVVQRVAADGGLADQPAITQSGLAAGAGGALVLQVRDGDLQVNAGVGAAGGPVLLDVWHGALTLAANVASSGGAVSLLASGVLRQTAASQVQTGGGSLDVQAAAVTMADGATLESAGGAVRVAADGAFTVARLDAGAGTASVQALALRDVAGESAAGADISAGVLRLAASGSATSDGVGTAADALELAVAQLAVDSHGGGVFLAQDGALLLDSVGPLSGVRVQADGTVLAGALQDSALVGIASAGALVLRVNAALQGSVAAALSATGNLLLQTQGAAADLQANGAIASSAGHVSLLAGRDLRLGGAVSTATAARSLDLEAGRDILLAEGSSVTSRNGAIRLQAGGSATLESLNAGSAGVAVQAGGGIVDGDAPGDVEIDITAAGVLLQAGDAVGQGANALETAATTLSASAAAGGVFLTESSGLRVDTVSVTVNRVAADASAAALAAATQEDLRTGEASALTLTVLAGDLTVAGGSVSAASGINSGGAVLLDARAGKVQLDAALQSAGGAVSLLARTDLALAAAGDIATSGAATVDLQAGGNMTMADGATVQSGSGNLRLAVTGTLTLGALQTTGDVSLAARSVTDSGSADLDIAAASLRLVTTGSSPGQGFGTGAQAIDLKVARLAANVAGTGAGGLFVREADDLLVDTVAAIAVDRVAADGTLSRGSSTDAALSDLVSQGNVVLTSSTGGVVLRDGNADNQALQATGNVRVDAVAGGLQVDGAVRTTAGHVSLLASGPINLNADVAIARTGRTLDLQAGGDLIMATAAVVSTVNSDVRLQAGGQLALGQVNAGNGAVSLLAMAGSILEAGSDDAAEVLASQLRLSASDGVGAADNRLETQVATVSARAAGGGIWLQDANAVTVGDTSVAVRRVGTAGTVTDVVDAVQSDLVTSGGNGGIALRTVDGNISLTDGAAPADGRSITADGSGVISLSSGGAASVLDATTDNIHQQGPVSFDSALRIQGTLQVSAGLAAGAGDGSITLQRAVDGNPGGVPDLLQLHADGAVRFKGAVGATQPLDGLAIDGANDVVFEQAVHLAGNLAIQASGVVDFQGPLTLDGAATLRIVGASQVLLNGVVVGTGDVTIQADDVRIADSVQSGGGVLTLTTARAGQAITLDSAGSGLVLDAAELGRLAGFSQVHLGDAISGAVAVDAQVLAALRTAALNIEGSRIDVKGSGTLVAGTDLLLKSRGTIAMTGDAQLTTAGGDASLRASGDIALGRITAAVVRLESGGTVSDAANDLALNVTAERLVMRGVGPALQAGASSTTAAIDVSAPTLEVDAGQGVVLRDSLPDGGARFNLLVGDALFQQLQASGPASRVVSTALSALSANPEPAQVAAWLGALRPLAELRETGPHLVLPSDQHLDLQSAAVQHLARNTASSAWQDMPSQTLSSGLNLGKEGTVSLWLDSLSL